jgi:dsRNA-specific ribonuclease
MQGIRNIPHPTDFSSFFVKRLPFSSSSPEQQQAQQQGQAINPDLDDDDVTLDNLGGKDDDEYLAPLAVDDKNISSPSRSLRERYRLKVRKILTSSANLDPSARINQIYQNIDVVQSLNKCFEFHSKHKGAVVSWRCTFQCPVSGEKATSTLPAPLLDPHLPLPTDDDVMTILKNVMGTFQLIDGVVYYASKKMAKKMCALAILLELPDDKKKDNNASTSKNDARSSVRSEQDKGATSLQPQSSSSRSTVVPSTSRKRTKFPWWAQKLYKLGVDTADISYREYCVSTSSQEWTVEPTLLCCILSVTNPIQLTVVGKPSSCRNDTLNTAVGLLEQEIHRQLVLPGGGVVLECTTSPSGEVEKEVEVEKTTDAVERQERLLHCDVKVSTFFQPLASWACAPFHSKSPWYLYELILRTESGALLVEDRMNVDPSAVTRIGMLFPSDIEPPSLYGVDGIAPVIQAKFGGKPRNGCNDEFVTVELRNRSVIDPRAVITDGTAMVERLELLERFNRILMDWKSYGKTRPTRDCVHHAGRTYLFAPLCPSQKRDNMNIKTVPPLSIDWQLVEEELEGKMQPFLVSSRHIWCLPVVGEIRAAAVAMICILLGIAVLAPSFIQMVTRPHLRGLVEPSEILATGLLCSVALLAGSFSIVPPSKYLSWESLQNRFLCERKLSYMYVLAEYRRTVMTSYSAMPAKNLATETVESHQRKYRLNLRKTSFANYYFKKHALELQYPREILLETFPVQKHTCLDSLKSIPDQESCVYLVPELVSIFPIPRDFLYSVGLAGVFIPELERAISVSRFARSILEPSPDGASNQHESSTKQLTSASKSRLINYHREFSDSLSEATSLFPVNRYERLEFLGDAVLGYFLALNTLVSNASLAMDFDEIKDVISADGRNSALVGYALRTGLPRLVRAGKGSWQSIYGASSGLSQKRADRLPTDARILDPIFESPGAGESVKLGNSNLSDIVESVLAATYLSDMGDSLESSREMTTKALEVRGVTVALLEKLLPSCSTKEKATRFSIFGPCLRVGYPFEMDLQWANRLSSIQTVVASSDTVFSRLNEGFRMVRDKLLSVLLESSVMPIRRLLEKREVRALVFCALFDDSLDGISSYRSGSPDGTSKSHRGRTFDDRFASVEENRTDGRSDIVETLGGFLELALVRDNLYYVGAYGLQLMVTDAIFRRYPGATPGDLHLLRVCAIGNDIIVYVMIKAGIHLALFDQTSSNVSELESEIVIAGTIRNMIV